MVIPKGAKPLDLRDYEAQALADGRLGAIVRAVKPQLPHNTIEVREVNPIGYLSFRTTDQLLGGWGNRKAPLEPGQEVWCKEAWAIYDSFGSPECLKDAEEAWFYSKRFEPEMSRNVVYLVDYPGRFQGAWHSPVTMPREAAEQALQERGERTDGHED